MDLQNQRIETTLLGWVVLQKLPVDAVSDLLSLTLQPNRWMSQLNASGAVHVVLDIKVVVVSTLVRGLILRRHGGRLVHCCAGIGQVPALGFRRVRRGQGASRPGGPRRRACTAIATDPPPNQAT
jgi:hypothetical protein